MEPNETTMPPETGDPTTLRNYLLGKLGSDALRDQIEMRLLTDDTFAEELEVAENLLIEEYLDGSLDRDDTASFNHVFLASPKRKEQLRLVKNLRKVAAQSPALKRAEAAERPSIFSLRWVRVAAAAAILIIAVVGLWRSTIYQSDVDKGLAELRSAYKGQRVSEARITALPAYSPMSDTRGPNDKQIDELARQRADVYMANAVREKGDARAHHGAAILYLAENKSDLAQREFEQALSLSPKDPKLLNDAGAFYLDRARAGDPARTLESLAQALSYFDRAIELDGSQLEALFNKGLALRSMKQPAQEREAWQTYLQHDSTSPWSQEARKYLRDLDERSRKPSTDDSVRELMSAYQAGDDERAVVILTRNREMITGRLIPQQLIWKALASDDPHHNDALVLLTYAGQVESRSLNDHYFADIARFYASLPAERLELLRRAQTLVQNGYDHCLASRYSEALDSFNAASEIFNREGSILESNLADYWRGYCEFNRDHLQASEDRMKAVVTFTESKNYPWLASQAYYWLSVVEDSRNELTKASNYAETALRYAEQVHDQYQIDKAQSSLAGYQLKTGLRREAAAMLWPALHAQSTADYSDRQRWRDLTRAASILFELKQHSASASYETEALRLNETLGDVSFGRIALANLSRIYSSLGKSDVAIRFAEQSRAAAETAPDEPARRKGVAYALLYKAAAEFDSKDFSAARADYESSVAIYGTMEYSPYQYLAEKGRLACLMATHDDHAVQDALPRLLDLFEKNRDSIREEQSRNTFFDKESDVYDLAIGYEYDQGNFEQAFNYAEASRARSLLDSQQHPGRIVFVRHLPTIVFDGNAAAKPLTLADIRAELPTGSQVLYYAVLPSRTIIWLLSGDRIEHFSSEIDIATLGDQVTGFLAAIQQRDHARQTELSRSLYQTLFEAVELRLGPEKQVVVIPDKILCGLPMSALVTPRTGHYLIEDGAFSYAPSGSLLVLAAKNAMTVPKAHQERLLAIGDPAFDTQQFPALRRLPAAEEEAKKISEKYEHHRFFSGNSATGPVILAELSKADVFHFAGHYSSNSESYLLSGFAVAGTGEASHLRNYQILQATKKMPELVLLSACDTGAEGYYAGEGMISGARVFLSKGSSQVIASLWPVDSKATQILMDNFHRFYNAEEQPAMSALRRAQLEMIRGPEGQGKEPYYWASFINIGVNIRTPSNPFTSARAARKRLYWS